MFQDGSIETILPASSDTLASPQNNALTSLHSMLWSQSKAPAYGYGSLVAGASFPQSLPWRETGGCNQSQHCKQFANPPSSRTLPTKATHADQCDLQSTDWQARHVEYKLRTPWFQAVPFQQFQALFNSLFKVLFIFPSRYLFAIGLLPIFSFRWNLPPT